jgi:hypothetical protein
MSIIGKLKSLIFGASAEPVEQVPIRTVPQQEQAETIAGIRHHRFEVPTRAVPHPEQAESSKAGDNEPRFSEDDMLVLQQRAETVQRAFNESLSIASQSKNRGTREYRLQIARERLIELKKLANKFPFFHLDSVNLQTVEASIIAVEAETRSLPYGEVVDTSIKDVSDKAQPESSALQEKEIESPERSAQDRQHYSASDEQAILLSIQSFFRVINESIVIARKSKNLETKVSRLGVARNSLKEAQKQAGQFSLKVDGFDAAEAEINRIAEAIKTGTPTEIAGMLQVDVNTAFSSPARDLLIEATALKREKKYIEACDKLREAYSADGAENLIIEERLRFPMYLLLAGRNDEGWDELNRLNAQYVDQISQPTIASQMRVFLKKEGKNREAAPGIMNISREDARALVHSRIQTVANAVRIETFEKNMADVVDLLWLATLDSHTCLICAARDMHTYSMGDHEPLDGGPPWGRGPANIHFGCRCIASLAVRPIEGMPPLPIGGRASSIGPVPGNTDFAGFLERKGRAFQDEYFGPGRVKLWREKKLTLEQMLNARGQALTLAELKTKYG